jgi:hypothetical protein
VFNEVVWGGAGARTQGPRGLGRSLPLLHPQLQSFVFFLLYLDFPQFCLIKTSSMFSFTAYVYILLCGYSEDKTELCG